MKFKILGHEIDVLLLPVDTMLEWYKRERGPSDDDDMYGCYLPPNKICIDINLKGTNYLSTLNHEITERINDAYCLELPHPQIGIISEVFTQVLIDNKDEYIKILTGLSATDNPLTISLP